LKDSSELLGPSLYRSVDSNFVTKREDVLLRFCDGPVAPVAESWSVSVKATRLPIQRVALTFTVYHP
jgi:hypothetical protein